MESHDNRREVTGMVRANNRLTVYCECTDPAHSMEFYLSSFEGETPELYVSVQLNQIHPWWKRLGYGLMYVLGKRSRFSYGHWDEGSIGYDSVKELIALIGRFVEKHNEFQPTKQE